MAPKECQICEKKPATVHVIELLEMPKAGEPFKRREKHVCEGCAAVMDLPHAPVVQKSVVDIWIMAIMGALGFVLRKLDFETAPIVLGLILAPMLELSVRQALAMSAGDYSIFYTRPISAGMLILGAAILAHALWSAFSRRRGWRAKVGLEG